MNPTIGQLRMVVSVADTGSFSDSARRALVSQPSLSRAVLEVERGLGVRLFDRTTRSVTVTPEGVEFVRVAREIVRNYDEELSRFASYRAGDFGALTITALPSVAAGILPDIAARFVSTREGTEVRILDDNASETVAHIRTGAADIAITELPIDTTGLLTYRLGDDDMVAVLPVDHPLAQRSKIAWNELAESAFIALEPGSSLRRLTDRAFADAHAQPRVTLETRAIATAAGMVAAGLGVTAVTRSVLPVIGFVPWRTVPLVEPAVTRVLAIVIRDHPRLSPLAQAFLQQLRADLAR